jgi:hypothetical protein
VQEFVLTEADGPLSVVVGGGGACAGVAVAAAVAGAVVDPVGVPAPPADPAPQQSGEAVGPRSSVAGGSGGADGLDGDEVGFADQRRVRGPGRDHPLVGGVPLLDADSPAVGVPVLDVLAVPHLAAGVAGVGDDRPDGLQGPGPTVTVPVTAAVGLGRTRHAPVVQVAGDADEAAAGQALGEDPQHGVEVVRSRGRGLLASRGHPAGSVGIGQVPAGLGPVQERRLRLGSTSSGSASWVRAKKRGMKLLLPRCSIRTRATTTFQSPIRARGDRPGDGVGVARGLRRSFAGALTVAPPSR